MNFLNNLKNRKQEPPALWKLRCIIEGTDTWFWVTVKGNVDISQLKDYIYEKASRNLLRLGIDSMNLIILKVRTQKFWSGIDSDSY
jgi:hypothetical protein